MILFHLMKGAVLPIYGHRRLLVWNLLVYFLYASCTNKTPPCDQNNTNKDTAPVKKKHKDTQGANRANSNNNALKPGILKKKNESNLRNKPNDKTKSTKKVSFNNDVQVEYYSKYI